MLSEKKIAIIGNITEIVIEFRPTGLKYQTNNPKL